MKCKKIMIMLILVVFLFSIASICAADVNDSEMASEDANQMELALSIEMNEDNLQTSEGNDIFAQANDDGSVSAETDLERLNEGEGNYTDLRTDIENGGNLTKSHYSYTDGDGDTIEITTPDMVINGNGAVIDMLGSHIQAFRVSASGVTIKNLTIKNANYEGKGGAIYFSSSGAVENCNFTNNKASSDGGAIYVSEGSTGRFVNCNFANNSAYDWGGAVYFDEKGSVENCNFANNTVSQRGGAIYFDTSSSIYTVENCNFTNNNATSGSGGAVYCASICNVTDCNFADNNAISGSGGAVWSMAAIVGYCNFTDNSVFYYGGALWIYSGDVIRCNFIGNKAISGSGGAVRLTEDGNVTNCNFTNNSANEGGAVIFNGAGDMSNCNFYNNKATSDGGAAYFMLNGNVAKCNFTDNKASHGGGAVYFESTANVENCNFIGNSAGVLGGAVYFKESATAENCNFTRNNAYNGGAIHTSPMCYGNVTGCGFANNSAFNGGAVNMYTGIIENCNFASNIAENAGGAVIFSEGGCFADCNFVNNLAANSGGAISMFTGIIENCNFTGNNATEGSAINFNGFSGTNISNSRFLNNRANASANVPLNVTVNANTIEITFMGRNNLLNAIYSNGNVSFTNVTYWGVRGIDNTGVDSVVISPSNCEAGQNISVTGVVNGNILKTTKVTDGNGKIILENVSDYYLIVRHDSDSYYTEAEKTFSNMYVNVTSATTNSRVVNITAKSNIYNEVMPGELLFILPNSDEISANYASGGTWWAVYEFDDCGEYKVNASYIGLDGVTINDATIIILADVPISVNDVSINYGEVADVVVGVPESINGQNITITVNGNSKNVTVESGEAKASFADLAAGKYEITADYLGDDYNSANSTTAKLTVNKAYPEIIVSVSAAYYGKDLTVTVQMPADAARRPTVTIGDESKLVTMRNGTGTVKFSGLDAGTYAVVASYNGDANYLKASTNTTVKFKPIPEITVSASDITQGEDLVVTVQLPSDATRRPIVTIGDESKLVTMRNGTGSVKFTGLAMGTYSIDVSYNGDANYGKASVSTSIKVNRGPAEINVTANPVSYGEDVVIDVQLPSDVTRRVSVTVGNETKLVSLTNGSGSARFGGLAAGAYDVGVEYAGDSNYLKSSLNTTVKVNKATPDIQITADDINYGETLTVGIQLPSDVSRRATVKIDGVSKIVSLKNGVGSVKFTDLSKGTHDVIVSYEGDANYSKASSTTTINVS